MVAKLGRPASTDPKDFMLRVRLDKETLRKLDEICKKDGISRSQVVRNGIELQYGKK